MDQPTQTPESAPQAQGGGEQKKDYTKWIIVGVIVLVVLYVLQSMLSPTRMMERGIERAMEEAGGGDVDIDINPMGGGDARVNFKGENGETYEMNAGGSVSLPDNWPSSVPLMDGANITYAGTMMAAQGGGTSVAYTTNDSVNAVADYYKNELPQNGWTIAMTSATTDGAIVSATRGEGEGVMVYIGSSPEGTTVTMSVTAQQ